MSPAAGADQIEFAHFTSGSSGTVITIANHHDAYVLHAPLSRNRAKLERDGTTIYDGAVRAGVLGIVVPGEVRKVHVRSSGEAVRLVVPGPMFRRYMEGEPASKPLAAGSTGAAARLSNILTPHPAVERLARSLLLAGDITGLRQKQLFLQGMAVGLAAVLRARRFDSDDDRVRRREGLSEAEFSRCTGFAEANLDRRLDLSIWAAVLNMSISEFARRFQLKTGMSAYNWLLEQRVERARVLLQSSTLSLAQIALQVGFCSQSHFTDTFRRRCGISPGHFRGLKRRTGS